MELNALSKSIRRQILEEAYKHKHGHIASCFSCVEILLAIKEVMKPEDHFILSKGHAILAEKAVFGKEISVYKTGSLGHGLGVSCGIALSDPDHNVYVVVGDGELQEGSCWEAINFCNNHQMNNLKIVCDSNEHQASGRTEDILDYKLPLNSELFYDGVDHVNGHNIKDIVDMLDNNNMLFIWADTIKGKGISYMEADPIRFHTEIPNAELMQVALKELE